MNLKYLTILAFFSTLLSSSWSAQYFEKTIHAELTDDRNAEFRFEQGDGYLDLFLDDRRIIRFVHQPHDGTNQQTHYQTYKPFHHVFSPNDEQVLLTSGVPDLNQPHEYPHHRGLFFGFNRISYEGKQADTWHATNGVFTTCEGIELGPIQQGRASHTATIGWFGKDQEKFAEENRTVTLYNVDGGILLDWSTELRSLGAAIKLDGDPQHAGFHFRANQEVALENSKQTYFLRPDGRGEKGEERNWTPQQTDLRTVNLPWNGISFLVSGQRYTVLRINHRDNPQETRGSERAYGRFGDYFQYQLTPENPLSLKYRVWIQEGEMTVEQADQLYQQFNQED